MRTIRTAPTGNNVLMAPVKAAAVAVVAVKTTRIASLARAVWRDNAFHPEVACLEVVQTMLIVVPMSSVC